MTDARTVMERLTAGEAVMVRLGSVGQLEVCTDGVMVRTGDGRCAPLTASQVDALAVVLFARNLLRNR